MTRERVLDVRFKRTPEDLPTHQEEHYAVLRWDTDAGRLAIGTSAQWNNIPIVGDPLVTAGNLTTITHEPTNMGASSNVTTYGTNNNASGRLLIDTAGAGYGGGLYFTVTFSSPLDDDNYDVFVQPTTDDAIGLGLLRLTGQSASSFGMLGLVTPAVSKSYGWSYLVVRRE